MFGNGGVATTAFGSTEDVISGVAIQPDGKIIAAGFTLDPVDNSSFALARFTSSGTLDPTFDGDGKVTAADAQLVLMAAVGLPLPTGMFAFPNGDVNCDGVTNALDAQIILAFVVRQPTSQFCVNTIK